MARTLIRLLLAATLGLPAGAGLPTLARAAAIEDQDAANSKLLAAAEPFEALTEQAFTAGPVKFRELVGQVDQAAQQVNEMLERDAQSALGKQLAEIKRAGKANNSAAIALASVEGYRILVSAARPTKVPTAVNLLDYAGFRYDADLKSKPVRWTDMQSVANYAQEQWDTISGQVTDASLRNSFAAELGRMKHTAVRRSANAARSAVKAELALVDRLENYFNHR